MAPDKERVDNYYDFAMSFKYNRKIEGTWKSGCFVAVYYELELKHLSPNQQVDQVLKHVLVRDR